MTKRIYSLKIGTLLSLSVGVVFGIAAVITVSVVNQNLRQQALVEAEAKMRIILDRNMALHTYFSQIMKPSLFEYTEPFRSEDYFDPSWMSSTYALREMGKYFKELNPEDYYYKDAAINARSPENEADVEEKAFLEELNVDPSLEERSQVRTINGKPYLVVMKKGEVMEESCLRCHADPAQAPKELVEEYGAERSFHRRVGEIASVASVRVPLSIAYTNADRFSLNLSALLLLLLLALFLLQITFNRCWLWRPLAAIQNKVREISSDERRLGEQVPVPFGQELSELAEAFNQMSSKLRQERDNLEERVVERTNELDRLNQQLIQERNFAEGMVDTAQAIVLVLDPEGHIVRFNPYMEEISGFSLEDMQGKDWIDNFLPERIRDRVRKLFATAISDVQTRGNVNPLLTKDGRELLIEWYDKTLIDAEGNVLGLLAIGQDITERKQAEEALKRSEERYRGIVEFANEGIWIIDQESSTTFVNSKMAEMLGYKVEEMMRRSLFDFMDEEGRQIAEMDVERRKQGITEQHDFKFKRKDGQDLWALLGTCPLLDDEGNYTGALAMVTDITEHKRIDKSLRAALAEKEVLLREVHHRVKNNIQAIIYLVESRIAQVPDEQNKIMLKGIQEQARTMGLVYDQLHQSESLSEVRMEQYLNDLAANVVQAFSAGRRIELSVACKDITLGVETAMPCGLMVNELLTNALKYAFPPSFQGKPHLHISLKAQDDHFDLTVGDNGVGLPEGVEQGKQRSMGLRLVKLWATHQMGGTLKVESGEGVVYKITIPRKNG